MPEVAIVQGSRMSQNPRTQVEFVAKCPNQRLTMDPEISKEYDANKRVIQPHVPGTAVQFDKHRVTVTDEKIIEWLRNHRLFNTRNGFWEEGAAPDEPRPTLAEQMSGITTAAIAGNIAGIQEILSLEDETHRREPVLAAGHTAIEQVKLARSQAEADARQKAAEAAAKVAAERTETARQADIARAEEHEAEADALGDDEPDEDSEPEGDDPLEDLLAPD